MGSGLSDRLGYRIGERRCPSNPQALRPATWRLVGPVGLVVNAALNRVSLP